jgi:hypothetical protein
MQSKSSIANRHSMALLVRTIIFVAVFLGGEISTTTARASRPRPLKAKVIRQFSYKKPKLRQYISAGHACIRQERVYPKKRFPGFSRYR